MAAEETDLRYGSAPERRARLLAMVTEQGYCATMELARGLGVSDMTVRRDVQRLAEQGKVRLVHGGVSVLPQTALQGNGDYDERATRMAAAKHAVGRHAATLVDAGDVIAIDAGTTTLELAKALPNVPFTVVTNSVPVIAELLGKRHVQLVGLGGELHHDTQSFAGAATIATLENLRVDRLFLAASGVGENGVYCANDFDAVTKRALIEVADEVVLVVDSSKFSSSAMVRICRLDTVHRIVVDDALADPQIQALTKHNITITHPQDAP